jgi:hypothetical protein
MFWFFYIGISRSLSQIFYSVGSSHGTNGHYHMEKIFDSVVYYDMEQIFDSVAYYHKEQIFDSVGYYHMEQIFDSIRYYHMEYIFHTSAQIRLSEKGGEELSLQL